MTTPRHLPTPAPSAADDARLLAMLKALANPHRLHIVRTLARTPGCITTDLVDLLPLAQATVSQHMKVLRDAGIICGTVDGPAVNYCLDDDALAWLAAHLPGLWQPDAR